MQQRNILVLGDLMLDEFIWGKVNRISPEAPVPVVQVTQDSAYPGGAANVARNLADFGVAASVSGLIGMDSAGEKLLDILRESKISTQESLAASDFSTIIKTRIIARQQQVVRVDRELKRPLLQEEISELLSKLGKIIKSIDAIIIQDYGKGFINQSLMDEIALLANDTSVIVTVDPNSSNPISWPEVTMIKPNRHEAFAAAGVPYSDHYDTLVSVGNMLMDKWRCCYLLITLGEDGMVLFQKDQEPYHTPTKAREVYDVSGAGDTVIAFFTAALAAGLSGITAAEIANHAASIVVGKIGTATLTAQELFKSFSQDG